MTLSIEVYIRIWYNCCIEVVGCYLLHLGVITMEISLALIIDELGLKTDSHIPEGLNPKFRTVELHVVSETQIERDKLLVCLLSEAISAEKQDGVFFLCIRDKIADDSETELAMSGITIVRAKLGLRELYNRVNRIFVKVAEWVLAMERNIAKRCGLQDLLDIAEPIFNNFITIQDSSFKLVAYTKNIPPPGIVMKRLVHFGYHPPETMDLFRRYRRIEEFNRNTDVIVSSDKATSEYDVVKKTFHIGGSLFILVVMECCSKPADNSVVELFNILIDYVKSYADLDIAQTGGVCCLKSLALDILDKSAGSKEDARVRSSYCDYPFEGGFRLYLYSFEDENNVPTAHLINLLAESCKDAVAFLYKTNAMMIELQRVDIAKTCERTENALGDIEFICGISNDFNCLWDLPAAFEQAMIASDISSRLKSNIGNKGSKRFRFFSDNIIYHFVNAGYRASPGVFENSFLSRSISALREYDEQHKTETVSILRMFLENERSATTVASAMHMHRNTVLYHMEKICDLLDISLDDPDVRLQLLLAFKAEDFREL